MCVAPLTLVQDVHIGRDIPVVIRTSKSHVTAPFLQHRALPREAGGCVVACLRPPDLGSSPSRNGLGREEVNLQALFLTAR